METDKLRLFNTKLVDKITAIEDEEELWDFVSANEEKVKQLFFGESRFITGFFYAYTHGIEHFKKIFQREVEYYYEGVIFTLVMDFCFEGEEVNLDYYARCGYLDSADSCCVRTSEDVMPPVDEDSDEFYYTKYFHLLEPAHVENIIRAMEKNFAKLEKNTRKDIAKIKRMKNFCRKNEGWNVAYIYDI